MMWYLSFSCVAWLIASLFYGGNGCLVTPSAVAVIAGNNVSLTCTTSSGAINGWKRGSDYNSASIVYQAPVYGANNSIRVPRIVADGYFVDDSVDGQVILMMNNASTVQADRYYCYCNLVPSNAANVTVLVSKPTFSATSQITDGGPVNITCSISFSGTADASLTITDISGTKVAEKSERGTYPSNSNDLHVISLDYNTTANPSVNQTYFCQINLTDNSRPIYSEQLVTSVSVPVRNVLIIPVETNRCSNGSQCAINQTLNCSAEGNPYPVVFQWTGSLDGSLFKNNTSVTVEGPPTPLPDTQTNSESKTALIVGLVVGLGGSIITLTVIALVVVFCRRKKHQQNKKEVYTTLDVQRSLPSGMPQQDIYTDLQASPVDDELQNGHRVEAEQYETVIPLDFNDDN